MDLDQDGIKDLITGCAYEKKLHFFKGDGKGNFEASRLLRTEHGDDFIPGNFTNMTPIDWNGDGVLDIVFYSSPQGVQLMLGKGDLRYEKPIPLPAGGQTLNELLKISDGRVLFYDWNGDGVEDLILGIGDGSIHFFQGARDDRGHLSLDSGTVWLSPFDLSKLTILSQEPLELANPRSGKRPTISIADWNGDGKPDLLVGDLLRQPSIQRALLEYRAAHPRLEAISKANAQVMHRFREEIKTQLGLAQKADQELTLEEEHQLTELVYRRMESHPVGLKLQRTMQEYRRLEEAVQPSHGFVWVYLGKTEPR